MKIELISTKHSYSIGDVFIIDGNAYILSQVAPYELKFVGLHDGNRWSDRLLNLDKLGCRPSEIDPHIVDDYIRRDPAIWEYGGKLDVSI